MIRVLILLLSLVAAPLCAQEAPRALVETTLDAAEVVPGQSVTLRLIVLVPTWMPSPPDLPAFEAPNMRVRLPASRASTPTSRTIDGENWSGVSTRYLLTPMVPGKIVLPAQQVGVTYVGPDGHTPVVETLRTEPVTITGTLPAGAEGLDPFIAADSLELVQDLSGPTTGLEPGASVIRTITARIEGTSPIVLPPLMPQFDLPAIRVYPASPKVEETDKSGTLSGERVESETLMALGGGEGEVPAVRLDWFNLKTGKVETAEAPGFPVSVTGPPPKTEKDGPPFDWRMLMVILAGLAVLAGLLRWAWPPMRDGLRARRAARLASAEHARQMLLQAISRRDYAAASRWLTEWRLRLPPGERGALRPLAEAFARIGGTRYGISGEAAADWAGLERAVRALRPADPGRARLSLPALNPGHRI